MKQTLTIVIFFLLNARAFSQVPFEHISTSTFNTERVAKFGVIDVDTDFLEITNSTQFDGSFIPSIWAHQETDNRYVLRLFATTTDDWDDGEIPIMIFRTEFRSALNPEAPIGGSFPWGVVAGDIVNRPLFGWENGNTQLMTLRANGFLGLGTTTPTALFHTVGTIRHENLPNDTNAVFMLGTDADGNVAEYPVPDGEAGGTPDEDWLRPDNTVSNNINDDIYTNGNVGINVQNPQSSLHVDGTVAFENLPNDTSPAFMLGTDADGNVAEYPVPDGGTSGTPDQDWLKLDNTVSYSINDNIYTIGKVGIGTNIMPAMVGTEDVSFYSLYVTGGILTEEVRVALQGEWADYVFEENYPLPSLREVEEHIKANGHLKDIPSAAEVEANGIELAEMNKLLLQKVEELTLYMIEMDKKIDAQQKEIEALKTQKK